MTVFKKAVAGFNHNIKHKDRLYHIQTEDSGVNNPHVTTHLFLGGNVVASKKTSYTDIIGLENLTEVVRELMEEQHKEMLRNLINGAYDQAELSTSYAPGQLVVDGPEAVKPLKVMLTPPPLPSSRQPAVQATQKAETKPAERETVFGEKLISEKSLDEVILAYLAGETEK